VPGPKRTPVQALVVVAAEAGVPAAPPPGAASAKGGGWESSLVAVERKGRWATGVAGP
jgi:hypothetical protein